MFTSGHAANPKGRKGRPKLEETFGGIARQMLQAKSMHIRTSMLENGVMVTRTVKINSEKTLYANLMAALMTEAMHGNVRAIDAILDRTDGKAKEFIELTNGNADQKSFDVNKMSVEDKKKLRELVFKNRVQTNATPKKPEIIEQTEISETQDPA
jgi:hypothetical protein